MWAVSEMIDSAKEFIFILVSYTLFYGSKFCLLKLDLTSGLVAYSRTVSPSTSCILPRMAFRSSASKKGRRRCKDSCHCLQRGSYSFYSNWLEFKHGSLGYADQFFELETYEGNLLRGFSNIPIVDSSFRQHLINFTGTSDVCVTLTILAQKVQVCVLGHSQVRA
jgi:hypothetical protein